MDKGDIERFPCKDLNTINSLWLEHSAGKFGFSVQREIYYSLGGTQEFKPEIRDKFGDMTDWRVDTTDGLKSWRPSDKFIYDFDAAPRGHLPSSLWAGIEDDWLENRRTRLIALFGRMDVCSQV